MRRNNRLPATLSKRQYATSGRSLTTQGLVSPNTQHIPGCCEHQRITERDGFASVTSYTDLLLVGSQPKP